jgi:hypothetical protein
LDLLPPPSSSKAEPVGWARHVDARRVFGWERKLLEWANASMNAPFRWGECDCTMLAAEALDIQLGTQIAARHRGKYRTWLGAQRYIASAGLDVDRELERAGLVRIEVAEAELGDIVVAEREGFDCCHVCFGDLVLSAWPTCGVAWGRTEDMRSFPDVCAYSLRSRCLP